MNPILKDALLTVTFVATLLAGVIGWLILSIVLCSGSWWPLGFLILLGGPFCTAVWWVYTEKLEEEETYERNWKERW